MLKIKQSHGIIGDTFKWISFVDQNFRQNLVYPIGDICSDWRTDINKYDYYDTVGPTILLLVHDKYLVPYFQLERIPTKTNKSPMRAIINGSPGDNQVGWGQKWCMFHLTVHDTMVYSGTLQSTIHSSSQSSSDHKLKYLIDDFDFLPWGQGRKIGQL